ncbi:MAG TPA: oligosaccharide flippase family protein [Chitinophaga sp.]|uniref:lipopolysaccharide biosynthesis protein n=1 Tax=Chitinophaga sp. TaxID=1869181 RepID=UPI002C5F0AC2|nr:oligosaccharide flippase family protein [Chitinophaga sp.]HVI43889.1 oligosaccharide flippase family protein [Chitinophaga sp.]
MGVVKHQSLKSSILIYVGFAIGGINTLLLFPNFFTSAEFGLTRIMMDLGIILVPFCTFSTGTMVNRFYPYYASHLPKKDNDLAGWVLLASILGFLLFVAGTFIFKGLIIRKFGTNSPLFIDYFYLLYPFVLGMVLYSVFESYSWSRHETVMPNSLKEIGTRLFTMLLIGLYIAKLLTFTGFMWWFSLSYVLALFALLIYLRKKNLLDITFKLSKVTRRLFKRMVVYSLSIMGATICVLVAQNIDALIISSFKGLDQAAHLAIATYMATLIQVPQRSIAGIATPVMAQSWKDKNIAKIEEIYQKSALLQLVAALFIFLCIWLNIDNIYRIMPMEFAAAKYVVLMLGISKVIDMGTGVNQQLIGTSRYWRFELTSSIILAALSIPLNYFLIKKHGIIGSGYSSLISMFVFNTIRYFFIWKRFGLQPFSFNTLKALAIALLAYGLCLLIPSTGNVYADILIDSSVFAVLFGSGILVTKVSMDINSTFIILLNRLVKRKT